MFQSNSFSLAAMASPNIYISVQNNGLDLLSLSIHWEALHPAIIPLLIFVFRAVNLTLGTIRMLTIVRGRRLPAWLIGFIQAMLFVVTMSGVLLNFQNPWNLIAYAAGFSTGTVFGILLEAKLAPGHSLLRITSSDLGSAILETLHKEGIGATELAGRGKLGIVSVILCYVPRRQVEHIKMRIIHTDPNAFVTVENVRNLRGGWRA